MDDGLVAICDACCLLYVHHVVVLLLPERGLFQVVQGCDGCQVGVLLHDHSLVGPVREAVDANDVAVTVVACQETSLGIEDKGHRLADGSIHCAGNDADSVFLYLDFSCEAPVGCGHDLGSGGGETVAARVDFNLDGLPRLKFGLFKLCAGVLHDEVGEFASCFLVEHRQYGIIWIEDAGCLDVGRYERDFYPARTAPEFLVAKVDHACRLQCDDDCVSVGLHRAAALGHWIVEIGNRGLETYAVVYFGAHRLCGKRLAGAKYLAGAVCP